MSAAASTASTVLRRRRGEPGAAETEISAAARLSQLGFPQGSGRGGRGADRCRPARSAGRDDARRPVLRLGSGVHGHRPLQQGQDLPLLHRAQQGDAGAAAGQSRSSAVPEHHEARWVDYRQGARPWCRRACSRWCAGPMRIINHEPIRPDAPTDDPSRDRSCRCRSRSHRRRRGSRRSASTSRYSDDGRPTNSPCEICSSHRQRPLHRQAPSAEIGGRGSGRGILENRGALREEEARQRGAGARSRRTHRPC